ARRTRHRALVGRAHRGERGGARRLADEPREERGRARRCAARFHRAAHERGVRRPRRAHRLRRRGARAGAPRRQRGDGPRAGAGLGREVRLAGIPAVRGDAARARSGLGRDRDRERQDHAAGLQAVPLVRLVSALPLGSDSRAAREEAQAFDGLLRGDPGRHRLAPRARHAAGRARGEARALQALLAGWNADMRADEKAPLAFAAWYRELTRLVYSDELGSLFEESWDLRATFMIAVMKDENGEGRWCDDVATPQHETCGDMAARAFDRAARELQRRFGGVERWGEVHRAAGDQRPFGFVPYVKRLFNITPETPGDTYSVDVGHYVIRNEARPFANVHAPSLRAVYDLSDLDRSLFIQSTGESGNFLSPWYANLAERWAKVRYITIPT